MNDHTAWTADDQRYMQRALELARAAAENGEVPVGAVIVDPTSSEIVGEGANQPISASDPTAHAEIIALRNAASKRQNYRLTGLTLYVTLEPCAMCAGAISHARIGRLVYGATDPKGGAVTSGTRFFESASCHSAPAHTGGLCSEEAGAMLKGFFAARRTKS